MSSQSSNARWNTVSIFFNVPIKIVEKLESIFFYSCIERGKCRGGECIPYCETQSLQSCMCDTEQDACMRCCRRNLNSTCFPIMDDVGTPDPLKDGTPCYQGSCNKVCFFVKFIF